MQTNWILSRRTFLQKTGVAGALMSLGAWPGCSAGSNPVLRLGLLTDTHYADREPAGLRFYRESIPKMQECIERMNREKVDFVVHIGDFKDEDPEPDEKRTLSFLNRLEDVFSQFQGPRYHVLGNHDIDSISKEQFLARVENTGIPSSASYYSFDKRGFHFVVLDANFREDGVAYEKGNFTWTDTYIPSEQRNWLREDLNQTNKPTIVFVHQILDPEQTIEHQVKNAAEVRQILEESGRVIAVFQGHQHEGAYHLVNDVHYYTLLAMVDYSGEENNSYAILDVFPNGDLVVNGYRRVKDWEMKNVAS